MERGWRNGFWWGIFGFSFGYGVRGMVVKEGGDYRWIRRREGSFTVKVVVCRYRGCRVYGF